MLRFLCAVLIFCGACTGCRCKRRIKPVFPKEHWDHLSARPAGFNVDKMTAFVMDVGGSGCIVRYGYMIHKWGHYAHPLDVSSATKPVYAHLVYMAIGEGLIEDINSPVGHFVPELTNLNARLGFKDAGITWRQLVDQTSCYGVEEPPGTAFNYSDYQTALLIDTLVFKVYETGYWDADNRILEDHLCSPLICEDSPTLDGETSGPGRLRISARDFARFGLLYLERGEWDGESVLGSSDVATLLGTPHTAELPRTTQVQAEMLPGQRSIGSGENQERHMNSYSCGWWLNGIDEDGERVLPDAPPDTFLAQGHAGHDALVIIPSLHLIVCWIDAFADEPAFRYCEDGHKRVNRALKLLLDSVCR